MATLGSRKKYTSGAIAKFGRERSDFVKLEGVDKIVSDLIAKYYYAPDGSSLAQKALVKAGAVASGNLAFQGLLPDITRNEKGYKIEFHLNRDTPYWKTIEQGLQPGKAFPYDSIQIWITQKPTIQSRLAEIQDKYKLKDRASAIRTLAYFISRKIWNEGIEPKTNFFSKQHDLFLAELKAKLPQAIAKDIKLEIIGEVKK